MVSATLETVLCPPWAKQLNRAPTFSCQCMRRGIHDTFRPNLRDLGRMSSWLSWGFVFSMLLCFDYFRVSGMGWLIRSKARRWVGVGSVSVGTVISVSAEY